MTRSPVLAALLACLMLPASAGAIVYLDINAPTVRLMPVAVALPVPLEGTEEDVELAREVRSVMAGDLDFSGVFRVLDPILYLEEGAGIRRGDFDFADWELINAEVLVKVGYSRRRDGGVELEFHLYDVFRRREMTSKRYLGGATRLRHMAHRLSDLVMEEVTGEKGIFTTSLLYLYSVGAGKEVFLMDYDGAGKQALTANGSINLAPSWRPDGRGFLYTSYKGGSPDLYSRELRGGEKRITSGMGVEVGGEFAPDGGNIAFMKNREGNPDIYVGDSDGGRTRRLTRLAGVDASPTWSPDGSRIAYVSDRYGTPQLFVMNADGSESQRITWEGGYNTSPAWSPQGDLIAYVSRHEGHFAISLINPDTLDTRLLVGGEGDNEDPSWSPDGRFIAFSSNRDGNYQIYQVDREGRREIRVTSGSGDKTSPAWSPRRER